MLLCFVVLYLREILCLKIEFHIFVHNGWLCSYLLSENLSKKYLTTCYPDTSNKMRVGKFDKVSRQSVIK